jgi:hypothetical protein
MHVIGILTLLVQLGFAAHAIRRGHGWLWIYLIVFVPLIGCLLYTMMVLVPEAGGTRAARRASRAIVTTLDPRRDLRKRIENLDISDTVDNRIALAGELLKHGMVDESIKLYERSLEGIYRTDPHLLLGLATALFEAGDFSRAKEIFDTLLEENPDFKNQDGQLLHARVLEELGQTDQALKEYGALAESYPGAEAKCRYALLLKRLGRTGEARGLFEEILKTAKRVTRHSYRLNKEWITIAKRELA